MTNHKIVRPFFFIIAVSSFIAIFATLYFFRNNRNNNLRLTTFFNNSEINTQVVTEKEGINSPNYPFRPGEKLKYGIYSVGLKVGEMIITYMGREEVNGIFMDLIITESKAPGFNDVEKIYGDIHSFSPIRIERKIKLFGESIEIIEEYDQRKNEAIITRKSRKTTIKKIASENKISNAILLLYHFRYMKDRYKIGDTIKFNLPTKQLEMLIEKKTNINVPKGRFSAIFVRSLPARFKIWFDANHDRIPLRVQGDIGFGNTHLAFIDFEKSIDLF